MDHWDSQYLRTTCTNQIKIWGIQPSYAFVAEPQTNGVAERFNQAEGRSHPWRMRLPQHRGARDAVRDFVELYNAQWIVEKNGQPEPRLKLRQAWHAAISIRPAAMRQTCDPRNRVRYIATSVYGRSTGPYGEADL